MPIEAGAGDDFLPNGRRGRDKRGSEVLGRVWRDVGELGVRKI